MKFKLDENLSPSLAAIFTAAGHDAHSVTQQALNGKPDELVLEVCGREQRALVTLDLDFANILAYPPAEFSGIVVLRLPSQTHSAVESAVRLMLGLLGQEPPVRKLWIVEESRVRIR